RLVRRLAWSVCEEVYAAVKMLSAVAFCASVRFNREASEFTRICAIAAGSGGVADCANTRMVVVSSNEAAVRILFILRRRPAAALGQLDSLERGMRAQAGVVAEGNAPEDLAAVQIDRGEVAVGRLEQRDAVVERRAQLLADVAGVGGLEAGNGGRVARLHVEN